MGAVYNHSVSLTFTGYLTSDFCIENTCRVSFNSKELDEESGMYYYSARYYNSPTFISRDPHFEDYPTVSPYAYCGNNPVIMIDPDGRDWYENELTGEVFYNSQMGKNDAGTGNMTGDGWKWMGANDMFGEVNDDFINDNLDFLYSNGGQLSRYYSMTSNGIQDVDEMKFGGNSKEFMNKMGYKSVPTQVLEYTNSIVMMTGGPGGTRGTVDVGSQCQMTEKIGYVPDNYNRVNSKQIGTTLYGKNTSEYVRRLELNYSKGSDLSKIGKGWAAGFGGRHDYKKIGPCYPNMGLIDDFRNRYGSR